MKKQQIILIGIIIALIIAIVTVSVNIINSNKSKEAYSPKIQNENKENNEILYVGLENNFINETSYQNVVEENIIIENTVDTNNKSDNTNKSNNTETTKYKLEVNCEQNVVNVYTKDENGEYTNCVKVMLCSVGPATPTSGTYTLKKYDGWEWKGLFGDVYGQYATQITGNILFHSVPYTEKYNNASLEYWEYDKLGTPASMGCVRLTVENAKWIYNNCAAGTKVKFYEDSNPGPLGKPSERKISSETKYRNWDPTDPSSANPWKNYKKEEDLPKDENLNTENTENTVNVDTKDNNIVTNNESTNTVVNDIEINKGNNEIKSNQIVKENVVNTQESSGKVTENTTNSEITNKESKK